MIAYPKLNIALEYLEAAIEEREIHRRYFAAMNLAGVAEELLGKIIRVTGGVDQLTSTVDMLSSIQEKFKDQMDLGFNTKKEFKNFLASAKNGIKHRDNGKDSNALFHCEIEIESKWLIQAAIRNLNLLNIQHSVIVREFVKSHPEGSDEPLL
jgi:hypothetical protein